MLRATKLMAAYCIRRKKALEIAEQEMPTEEIRSQAVSLCSGRLTQPHRPRNIGLDPDSREDVLFAEAFALVSYKKVQDLREWASVRCLTHCARRLAAQLA